MKKKIQSKQVPSHYFIREQKRFIAGIFSLFVCYLIQIKCCVHWLAVAVVVFVAIMAFVVFSFLFFTSFSRGG